jgi:hypothetical protein
MSRLSCQTQVVKVKVACLAVKAKVVKSCMSCCMLHACMMHDELHAVACMHVKCMLRWFACMSKSRSSCMLSWHAMHCQVTRASCNSN